MTYKYICFLVIGLISLNINAADIKDSHSSTIAATLSEQHPVKVTVYNSSDNLSAIGHSVLSVTLQDKTLLISYPNCDNADLGDMGESESFYTTKDSFNNFLILYKTSPLVFKPRDVFEKYDRLRRNTTNNIAEKVRGYSALSLDSPLNKVIKYLGSRREPRNHFIAEKSKLATITKYPQKDIAEILTKFQPPIDTSLFDVDDDLKEAIYRYDIFESMLDLYRRGFKIVPYQNNEEYQLDANFVHDPKKLAGLIDNLAIAYDVSSRAIKEDLISSTNNLNCFSEETLALFSQKLGTTASSAGQELFAYLSEAVKQRMYYNASFDKSDTGSKVNCAGAICEFLQVLSNNQFQYPDDIRPRRPATIVSTTFKMVRALKQ